MLIRLPRSKYIKKFEETFNMIWNGQTSVPLRGFLPVYQRNHIECPGHRTVICSKRVSNSVFCLSQPFWVVMAIIRMGCINVSSLKFLWKHSRLLNVIRTSRVYMIAARMSDIRNLWWFFVIYAIFDDYVRERETKSVIRQFSLFKLADKYRVVFPNVSIKTGTHIGQRHFLQQGKDLAFRELWWVLINRVHAEAYEI